MERDWYPGYKSSTAKGEFVVVRSTDKGYLVEYLSGLWVGKFIEMPKEVGKKTQAMESLKLSSEKKNDFLDKFYDEFPQEYQSIFNYLDRLHSHTPSTDETIVVLREEHPPLFQLVLNKFLQQED